MDPATGLPSASRADDHWIKRLSRLATRPYGLSVFAQGLMSGLHFVLNLVLVRLMTPHDYGLFAFAFVLGMFASAINNALIATPLTVYTPVIKDPATRGNLEALFSRMNLLLSAGLLLSALVVLLWQSSSPFEALALSLFVSLYAARQYSRSIGYAQLKPLATAGGDLAYVISGALAAGLLLGASTTPTVAPILVALGAANLVAMLIERALLGKSRGALWPSARLSDYARIWPETRWALLGSLTTLFVAQAHSLIVTGVHGPGAFAPLAAGFVLFGPVRIALLTWQNMVKPQIAVALSEGRHADVRLQLVRTSLAMAVAVLLLGGLLVVAWPLIHEALYARQYADQPMGTIVGIWAGVTLCAALYNAPSAALQAMKAFRLLAQVSLLAALLSGLSVILLLQFGTPALTLYGVLAAESLMALALIRLLLRRLRTDEAIK